MNRPNMRVGALRLAEFREGNGRSGDRLFSRRARVHLWWPLLAMSLLIAAWTIGHADLWLADRLYAWEGGRWALKKAFLSEKVIHVAGRDLSALAWLSVLAGYAISIHRDDWSPLRRPLAYLLLATLTGTVLVAWIKSWSNVDCPWDLVRYGGDRPYIDLFSLRPLGLSRGRCFPAGHASGGYAWFALYFFLSAVRPTLRWWGLAAGLVLGSTFGISQQLRGAHFMSHDLWAATICWIACAGLSLGFWPNRPDAVKAHVPPLDFERLNGFIEDAA